MHLVQIDVVGLQSAQRAVYRIHDVLAGCPPVPALGAHGTYALGGHHEIITAAFEPPTHDFLGAPHGGAVTAQRINVGGVDERDTTFGRGVEDGMAGVLLTLVPERHGAEAQSGDGQSGTAEASVLHPRMIDPLARRGPIASAP